MPHRDSNGDRYFDYAAAESYLRESLDVLSKQRRTSDEHTQKAVRHLVELYEAWGKSEQAAVSREAGIAYVCRSPFIFSRSSANCRLLTA